MDSPKFFRQIFYENQIRQTFLPPKFFTIRYLEMVMPLWGRLLG